MSWDSYPAVLATPRSSLWLLASVVEEHGAHLWPPSGAAGGSSSWAGASGLGEGWVRVVDAILTSARGAAKSVHPSFCSSVHHQHFPREVGAALGGRPCG